MISLAFTTKSLLDRPWPRALLAPMHPGSLGVISLDLFGSRAPKLFSAPSPQALFGQPPKLFWTRPPNSFGRAQQIFFRCASKLSEKAKNPERVHSFEESAGISERVGSFGSNRKSKEILLAQQSLGGSWPLVPRWRQQKANAIPSICTDAD